MKFNCPSCGRQFRAYVDKSTSFNCSVCESKIKPHENGKVDIIVEPVQQHTPVERHQPVQQSQPVDKRNSYPSSAPIPKTPPKPTTGSPIKPTQQFIEMIKVLFMNNPKTITQRDVTKHNLQACSFYSIAYAEFINIALQKSTQPFSDQIMIEVSKGADETIVGTPGWNTTYTRTSPIRFGQNDGKGLIYWEVNDERRNIFTIVKLLAADNTTQIKILAEDQMSFIIHNVCELPQM